MTSFSILNLVLVIGDIALGIFFILARPLLARDLAQKVEAGELTKEEAIKKAELLQNCGWLLTIGGSAWLVYLLLQA